MFDNLIGGARVPSDDRSTNTNPSDPSDVIGRYARADAATVASVIEVADYDEALSVANVTEFGLSAGIFTSSLKYSAHFKRYADAGMVMVNAPDGRSGLSRVLRRTARVELWSPRTGSGGTRVLHGAQDGLYERELNRPVRILPERADAHPDRTVRR